MLTISKPLSAGQAQTYHKEEFANAQENYYSEGDRIRGEWHGRLAQEWELRGEVQEEHFQRLLRERADLVDGLVERGARVTSVPVYRWALPEDVAPLQSAAEAVAEKAVRVALFTSATQVVHLLQVAEGMGIGQQAREGLQSMAIASIGPTTSDELREQGIAVDIEASHPKMGFLVREAAERASDVLRTKREKGALG